MDIKSTQTRVKTNSYEFINWGIEIAEKKQETRVQKHLACWYQMLTKPNKQELICNT